MSDHKKCPSSEKEHEKCIFRLSYFHRIEPRYKVHMGRQSLILTVTLIGDFSVVMPRQGSVGTSISDISNHIIIPTIYRGCHQLHRLAGTLSILTRKGYLVSPLHITLQYNNIPKVPVTTMQGSGQRQG